MLRVDRLVTSLLASLAVLGFAGSSALAATSPPAPPSASTPSPSAATGSTAAPAPASTAPAEVTWGIGPAITQGANERPFFSFGVTPGAQATDQVTVVNYSLTALDLTVYAVQADNNADTGAIGFVNGTDTPVDVASWLTVGSARPVSVTVPGRANASSPAGQTTLPVKLIVPTNAQPGDHVAGIVAALQVASKSTTGEQVKLDQRVVTRVYVRVSGPLHPNLQITDVHATYHSKGYTLGAGSASVSYTVRNVGNVRVAASQSVHVSGLFGSSKKVTPANIVQLLPGGAAKVSVVVPDVWPTVVVRPHISVTPSAFAGDVDPHLQKISADSWSLAIPWGWLVIIVIAIGAWVRRRHRRRVAPTTRARHAR